MRIKQGQGTQYFLINSLNLFVTQHVLSMRLSYLLSIICFFAFTQLYADSVEKLDVLNTPYDELNPIVAPAGDVLYFTRSHYPQNTAGERDEGDIWYSTWDSKGWSAPKRVQGPVNNGFKNEVVGFSADGKIMYLEGNYRNPGKQGISFSVKIGENWSEPTPIDIPYFHNNSKIFSGSVSADGKVMVMSMESYVTEGNEDIYISFRKDDTHWTEPRNLGTVINTKYQELTPYLSADNQTLYFSTNAHKGRGGRDIFMSHRQDASWFNWSEPENLKEFNTKGADWYFKMDKEGKVAYYVSTQNSIGYGDIWKTPTPPELQPQENIQGTDSVPVDDNTSLLPDKIKTEANELSIQFKPVNEVDGSTVDPVLTIRGRKTANSSAYSEFVLRNGNYTISLQKNLVYTITSQKDGFIEETRDISPDSLKAGSVIPVEMIPLKKGTTIQLNNILFERGTANMLPSSEPDLTRVLEILKKNPSLEIEVSGHTDNRGDRKLNLELSQQRADTVKAYLLDNGIDAERVQSKGYGSSKPIASNKQEKTRKLNRRVEFTILKE